MLLRSLDAVPMGFDVEADESLAEALKDVTEKQTLHLFSTKDGCKKGKARIVLLGSEHPDLLSETHKTSSPVQDAPGHELPDGDGARLGDRRR